MECCFCRSTQTTVINGAPFCDAHSPERTITGARTLTIVPDRCERCGEHLTPRTTRGSIKCRCDQPSMPHNLGKDDDKPPMQVRYGN